MECKEQYLAVDKISYDVPMQFISSKAEIRHLPDDMDSVFILSDGRHYPVRRTDRNGNCRAKRENQPAIDYSKTGGASFPQTLRK